VEIRALVAVRCLSCGSDYVKPGAARSTTRRNPGCPECGYLGWMPVHAGGPVLTEAAAPIRFDADPRRRHPGREG
jgi:hypothetical protein